MKVITNNKPRDIIDACELTDTERKDFDYLDWPAIAEGRDSASFFRYRGGLYYLGEFRRDYEGAGLPGHLAIWDGYLADSDFSAVVVRYVNFNTQVVAGLVLSYE